MNSVYVKSILISLLLIIYFAIAVSAQTNNPVKITFDKNSKRIDLITGKQIPDYKLVQRGSFLFYLDRLDKPDTFFNFYHDGVNKAQQDQFEFIEKIQAEYDIWRFRYLNGSKNTPRIHHKAISFIPISSTGQPEQRVFVLFNDLQRIDWGKETK
jgi:hypothetical protein